MIKMNLKKLTVLFLVLTMALAGLAVGYGHWVDRVDIIAQTANPTGSFCWGFDEALNLDPCDTNTVDYTCDSPDRCDTTFHQLGTRTGDAIPKNVGCTVSELLDPHEECEDCNQNVRITVNNGYPSYASKTTVGFRNCGQYGVYISKEWLETSQPGYYLHTYTPPGHTKCGWLVPDDGDTSDDTYEQQQNTAVLDICWRNYEGVTLASGDATEGVVFVHVLQPAAMDSTYYFDVAIETWAQP